MGFTKFSISWEVLWLVLDCSICMHNHVEEYIRGERLELSGVTSDIRAGLEEKCPKPQFAVQ